MPRDSGLRILYLPNNSADAAAGSTPHIAATAATTSNNVTMNAALNTASLLYGSTKHTVQMEVQTERCEYADMRQLSLTCPVSSCTMEVPQPRRKRPRDIRPRDKAGSTQRNSMASSNTHRKYSIYTYLAVDILYSKLYDHRRFLSS